MRCPVFITFNECLKEDCAWYDNTWYDKQTGKCVMLTICDKLCNISDNIFNLRGEKQ